MDIFGRRYELKRNESELKEIEKDLAKHLGVSFVRCGYDCMWSHKYQEECEKENRKEVGMDYIINYEIFDNEFNDEEDDNAEDRYNDKSCGGDDGEVHELFYLLCNGRTYQGREIIISGL